jgi:molybdopterin synthase catalytic subunit
MRVIVTQSRFSPEAELASFAHRDAGAMATFIGYTRPTSHGEHIERLELEHYPGFTEAEIRRLAEGVASHHDLLDVLVIHRVGDVPAREPIVLVAALSAHRAEAIAAVGELMDYLKTDAPIWKKEIGSGGERWIEPTDWDRSRRGTHERKGRP